MRRLCLFVVPILLCGGCHVRRHAEMAVWRTPRLFHAQDRPVVLAEIAGDPKWTVSLRDALHAPDPGDSRVAVTFKPPDAARAASEIGLVSYQEGPSDLAIAASRSETDRYVLRGEILPNLRGDGDDRPTMRVSWRLIDVAGGESLGGHVLRVQSEDEDELIDAVAKETRTLLAPSTMDVAATLEATRWLPGSKALRQGISAAQAGDWLTARDIWTNFLKVHPSSDAAMHNLAVASVAAQDFEEAKAYALAALEQRDSVLHRETLAWVEHHQRMYHRSFGLPTPEGGWRVGRADDSEPENLRR